jgi:hypothetical protein
MAAWGTAHVHEGKEGSAMTLKELRSLADKFHDHVMLEPEKIDILSRLAEQMVVEIEKLEKRVSDLEKQST